MLIDEFLAPRTLIISGKGGVGKTTVAAALALVAARHGRKVCIAEVDRKGTLPHLFDVDDLSYEPSELSPGVWGMNIVPEDALAEYLKVQYHMNRIARVFKSTHFVDFITTAAPGLKDILVLGKIWYLEQGRSGSGTRPDFDTIIVDAPAAGHMLTFLSAPIGLSDAVRLGPVQRQSEWLVEMLRDPARTRVHLVTLPEEMPVTETLETARALGTRLGIDAGAVIANGVYQRLLSRAEEQMLGQWIEADETSALAREAKTVGLELEEEEVEGLIGYARFLQARRSIQEKHLRALRKGVEEPVVELPFLFSAGIALPNVETLADHLEEKVIGL